MKHTIKSKQIFCHHIHSRSLGGGLNVKRFFSSNSSHVAYEMNKKVDHAYTMVIYAMDGLGIVEFPLIR